MNDGLIRCNFWSVINKTNFFLIIKSSCISSNTTYYLNYMDKLNFMELFKGKHISNIEYFNKNLTIYTCYHLFNKIELDLRISEKLFDKYNLKYIYDHENNNETTKEILLHCFILELIKEINEN